MATRLDGKTWLRYSISVWDDIEKSPEEKALGHPALYPAALVRRLLEIYLPEDGKWVLDPFAGCGSTLVAAQQLGLSGLGIEIVPEFAHLAYKRLAEQGSLFSSGTVAVFEGRGPEREFFASSSPAIGIVVGDARNLPLYCPPRCMDVLVTSPPYWHIHTRRRTADRKKERPYSDKPEDIGNIVDYEEFLGELQKVFEGCAAVLKPGSAAVVNVMDIRVGPEFIPYHMDIVGLMKAAGFRLRDIIIWDRRKEYNNLRPLGYPHKFIVNKVHEYLLVFELSRDGSAGGDG